MLVENKWLNCFNMQSSVLPKVHENMHKIYMKCWYILRALYISRLQRRKKCDWDSKMPNAKRFAWYLNATTIGNIFFAIMTKRERERKREKAQWKYPVQCVVQLQHSYTNHWNNNKPNDNSTKREKKNQSLQLPADLSSGSFAHETWLLIKQTNYDACSARMPIKL